MHLAQAVYHSYLTNKHLMSEDKQFHFATRIAAWLGTPEAFTMMRESRNYIVQPSRSLDEVIHDMLHTPQVGRRNAQELRQPFFDKYPALYGAHLALFRVRHLEAVFGIDAREALFKAIPKTELIALKDALLADDEAVKALSTFAINYCYLLERVVLGNKDSLPLEHFYKLGQSYDLSDTSQVQLMIYLYTHCIIGESNFYTLQIPVDKLPIYRKMLTDLETLIESRYDDIKLDNKLEFLVCARICKYDTPLSQRIYEECEHSVSPEGTFLIDVRHNKTHHDLNDFIRSEHRNVLFIMSTSPYKPHSTLLS